MVSFYNETEREKGRFIAVISIDKWYYYIFFKALIAKRFNCLAFL